MNKILVFILMVITGLIVCTCDLVSVGHKFATSCEKAAWSKSEVYNVRTILLLPNTINSTISITNAKSFKFYGDLKCYNCERKYQSSIVFTGENTTQSGFKSEMPLPPGKFLFEGGLDYLNLNGRVRVVLSNGQTWESTLHSERCIFDDLVPNGSGYEMYLAVKNTNWWQVAN